MKKRFYSMQHFGNFACLAVLLMLPSVSHAQVIIRNFAGIGSSGYSGDGGPATVAALNGARGMAVDMAGNVYIADGGNHSVRKIVIGGTITTVAGHGPTPPGYAGDGGPATSAGFDGPQSVALDRMGNMYIGDYFGRRVRRVNTAGIITTFAGTGMPGYSGDGMPATAAEISSPYALTTDTAGNVYFSDEFNHRVRKIDTSGIITTFAGSGTAGYFGDGGPATSARLNRPEGITIDNFGNLYIADFANHVVRKVDAAGIISTVAGVNIALFSGDGGPATAAGLFEPSSVAADAAGNLFIADYGNNRVRKVDAFGIISTFAGNGSLGFTGDVCDSSEIEFDPLLNIALDTSGYLYESEGNYNVRKLNYNHVPVFASGHSQALTVCKNVAANIDTLLTVTDADAQQSENWSIVAGPLHGVVFATYATIATGALLTPTGLSYTPAMGYTGADSFSVSVRDCVHAADTTVIHVTVANCALITPGKLLIDKASLIVLPNPNDGCFTINLASPSDELVEVFVTTMTGVKMQEISAVTNKPTALKIRVPGVYFLTVIGAGATYSAKVVIH